MELKCENCIKKESYIKALEQEIDNLKCQLKVVEKDRDDSKIGLQRVIALYLEVMTQGKDKNNRDILREMSEKINKMIKDGN